MSDDIPPSLQGGQEEDIRIHLQELRNISTLGWADKLTFLKLEIFKFNMWDHTVLRWIPTYDLLMKIIFAKKRGTVRYFFFKIKFI